MKESSITIESIRQFAAQVSLFRICMAILSLIFTILVSGYLPAMAAGPSRILVTPFVIHADKNLDFLKNGIQDMLGTRLTHADKTVVISRRETDKLMSGQNAALDVQQAVSLGKKSDSDYVLVGSVTVLEGHISTDGRFMDVADGKVLVTYNKSAQNLGEVITHVNQFAEIINTKVFGVTAAPEAGAGAAAVAPIAAPGVEAKKDSRAHPDTLMSELGKTGSSDAGGIFSESAQAPIAGNNVLTFWKSQTFKTTLRSVGLGDVDNDGRTETVIASDNILYVFRFADNRFIRLAEINGKKYDEIIAIDVADINGNGLAEIYVTSIQLPADPSRRVIKGRKINPPQSYALEWNGTAFAPLIDDQDWYWRVIHSPQSPPRLFGQKSGIKTVFSPGVYELHWTAGRLETGDRFILPKTGNVFGFVFGDVRNDNEIMTLIFTKDDYLKLVDSAGAEQWTSTRRYGGTPIYLSYPSEIHQTYQGGEKDRTDRFFLPQRLHLVDFDADKQYEIIAGNNNDSLGSYLPRERLYNGGHIDCLTWENLGMYPRWRTQELSGYIADTAIGDLNNDGQPELVYVAVAKSGLIFGKEKSFIVAQQPKK